MGPRLIALALLAGCQIALDVREVPAPTCADHKAPIGFVQFAIDNPRLPRLKAEPVMPQPETECDFNVVHIAWGSTAPGIASVTDDLGNTYVRTTQDSYAAVYYAAAIKGGANTIHVALDGPSDSIDVRVLEYQGIDPVDPLDGATSMTGAGEQMTAGPVTTTHAYDLLVSGDSVSGQTLTPFALPWTQRAFSMPNGNIAVDQIVTSVNRYTVASPQEDASPTAWWTINLVAFRGVLDAPP